MTLLSALIALAWAGPPGLELAPDLLSARPLVEADGVRLAPGTYGEVLESAVDWRLMDQFDLLLERASGRAPAGTRRLTLYARHPESGRLVPAQELLPEAPPVPVKEPGFRSIGIDQPGAVDGALSGKAVYISQCHGWIWYDSLGRFATQRGNLFDTVEDFHNPEGANQFLVRYLENMGARVYTAKERDVNREMAIVDNGDGGYRETGNGFSDGAPGFAALSSIPYGVDPFDAGSTRTFPADGGGVASWEPTVPVDGMYAVYVSWDSDPGNASDAHYRITHPGGVIDRTFDQTVHGSTWQYVETLWLPAGKPLTIELIGDSAESGKALSADAVRIGGGMTQVTRQGANPNRPRWETGAIQYTQFNGAPPSVYDPSNDGTSGDGGSDPSARSRWAAWEHPSGEDAVYLSWHSNAASSTARGTVTYWAGSECSNPAVAGSGDLAAIVQDAIVENVRALRDPAWNDRGTATSCFSEVSPTNNSEMPSVLVELAFHDNADDTAALKDPTFRLDASRGMAHGIARYFAERDGLALTLPPEPPVDVALRHEGGVLTARWAAPPSGSPYGDAADSYLLYRSADGRSWDNGTEVFGTSAQVAADYGETVFVRIAGKNPGGVSFPSEVVGARLAPSGQADALVVAAFDRMDAGLLDEEYKHASLGDVKVFVAERTNAYDIVRTHGQAIADAGYTFDAVSDEVASTLDLSDYAIVVWATGEESTVDETFSAPQQTAVKAFVDGGGALFASGAEIFWDLDERGDADDQAFALGVLGAGMENDAASSSDVDGEGPLAGIVLDFGDGAYPVEFPDVLASGRTAIARYGDGGLAGVVGSGVAVLGFPFDAVASEAARRDAMGAILAEIAPDVVPVGPGTLGDGPTTTDPGTTDPGTTDPEPTDPGTQLPRPWEDDPNEGLPPPPPEKKGCGCAASSGAGGWLGLMGLLPLAWRRRS
jgi:hypothetical protein